MTEPKATEHKLMAEIRRALGDYVASEGCSCCRDTEAHDEAAERLGKLLRVPKYKDGYGSCRDFWKYRSKK